MLKIPPNVRYTYRAFGKDEVMHSIIIRPNRTRYPAILLLILALLPAARFASAEDPDYGNDPNTAFPIDPNGSYVDGVLSSTGDYDWFRFTAVAEGLYEVTIHSPSGRKDITLYGPNDSTQITTFYASTATVTNNVFITHAGTTWLKVSCTSQPGPYYITVSFLAAFPVDTYPGFCTNPALLTVDNPPLYDGITSQGMDEDWFTFATAFLHKYQITLTRAFNTNIIFDLFDAGCGSSLLTNKYTATLVSWDSNYYDLKVHEYGFNAEGYYEVLVTDLGVQPDDHNNFADLATPINPEGQYIDGALQYSADLGSDEDWFVFTAVADGLYEVTLNSSLGKKELSVFELDVSGQLREITGFEAISALVTKDVFVFRAGTTWLKVYDGTGQYQVSVNLIGVFSTDTYPNFCSGPEVIEVNAPALVDGITANGVDEDWFTFSAEPFHKYQVNLYRASNTDIRFDLYRIACGPFILTNKTTLTLVSWDANDYDLRVHDSGFDANGYYEISVTDFNVQPDDFGNSSSAAYPINPNGQDVNGSIQYTADVGSDEDWLRFDAVIGTYQITLTTLAGRRDVAVYDLNDSNQLHLITSFYTSTAITNNVSVSRVGPCFLRIFSPNSSGQYRLAVLSPVPTCGDINNPYPEGDFNHDCLVDMADFATFAANWLIDSRP